MKLAVIDHYGNPGGGQRVLRALLISLKKVRPEVDITLFADSQIFLEDRIKQELLSSKIKIKRLKSLVLQRAAPFQFKGVGKFLGLLQQKYARRFDYLPNFITGAVHQEVEKLTKGFDLAFFPWPYFICCPKLKCPMVGTFHDFNFRYYFTGPTWHPLNLEFLNREIPMWLEKSTPVVSTHFMKQELEKFYPQAANKAKVIHLAPMSALSNLSDDEARAIVDKLGVRKDYILYPCHLAMHKNIGSLLMALFILKNKGHKIQLILTGLNTEQVRGRSCAVGIETDSLDPEVLGLGYISNIQMDALLQCAKLVVSTSLYEAGNGPALDAWQKGTPVAMSHIPSFMEHLSVQGVRAEVFDPSSPKDIADKIEVILNDPVRAKENAKISQEAIHKFSWEETARKYFEVFDAAIEGKK